jgi:hypothetical protein
MPLLETYNELTQQYASLKDDAKVIALAQEKAALDRNIAGGGKFTPRTNWDGTQHRADGTSIDFHLWVAGFDGSVFGGTVVANEGHTEIRVKGLVEANHVGFQTTEVIKGGKIALKFEGFVLDRRMILQISGMAPNGKPTGGMVSLGRRP